jgi:hypothetical protein
MLFGRVEQNSKISVRVDLYSKSNSTNISLNTQQSSGRVVLHAQLTGNPITIRWRQRNATDDRPVGSSLWEHSSAHVLD